MNRLDQKIKDELWHARLNRVLGCLTTITALVCWLAVIYVVGQIIRAYYGL